MRGTTCWEGTEGRAGTSPVHRHRSRLPLERRYRIAVGGLLLADGGRSLEGLDHPEIGAVAIALRL